MNNLPPPAAWMDTHSVALWMGRTVELATSYLCGPRMLASSVEKLQGSRNQARPGGGFKEGRGVNIQLLYGFLFSASFIALGIFLGWCLN